LFSRGVFVQAINKQCRKWSKVEVALLVGILSKALREVGAKRDAWDCAVLRYGAVKTCDSVRDSNEAGVHHLRLAIALG
jgi:hypothetical protein